MKQTTKVLLPLGLFMSIVIPITVKSLFTDTDFFENDESSKIDFLQPYKLRPENESNIPQLNVGEDGAIQVVEPVSQEAASSRREPSNSDERGSRTRKLNMPSSLEPSSEPDLLDETSHAGSSLSAETY